MGKWTPKAKPDIKNKKLARRTGAYGNCFLKNPAKSPMMVGNYFDQNSFLRVYWGEFVV